METLTQTQKNGTTFGQFKNSGRALRIWFDLSNSPHINLFAAMIRELQKDGHQIFITCRPLANTIELLDLHKFSYEVVGRHYGANKIMKAWGYPVRIWQLYQYLRPLKIDVAMSQSSFHSPLVAKWLGIPSIYMNDNEHALGNVPSFLFASTVLIPEFLNKKQALRQGASEKKLLQYPGVKEGIYLWNMQALSVEQAAKGQTDGKMKIYIRCEPWTAQYYKGSLNFMDKLITDLKDKYQVILLPRGRDQEKHYRGPQFAGIEIPAKPLSIVDIAQDCGLFIGAGGTMTRELAVLGIPTISVYQDKLLEVDEYLINNGCLLHEPDLHVEFVETFLSRRKKEQPNKKILVKGRQAYEMIKKTLLEKGEARL